MIRERKEKAFHFRFHFQGFSFLGVPERPPWAEVEPCVRRKRQKGSREGPKKKKKSHVWKKKKIPRPL